MPETQLKPAQVPEPNNVISPTALAHFVLGTNKFEEMRDWYLNVLGAETLFDNGDIVFLTYDQEHHRLAIGRHNELKDKGKPEQVGLHHVAFTYASLSDLIQTYLRLKADGILPAWSINHGMSTSAYYRDPDGNHCEIQVDNFKTPAELNEWLQNGYFDANPIGIRFDMEDLVARYNSGEPEQDILYPPHK